MSTTPPAAFAIRAGADSVSDETRRRDLRRMRSLAVALLVFAAVVYLATLGRDGFWGFVNAGAEASMVGAMADWFAVTAIFRHPLGLPIPHTALVPKRKAELGRSLEDFVADNFLQEEVIRSRLETAAPALRVGEWLGEERHARRIVDELAQVTALGLRRLRDDDVRAVVQEAIIPRLLEEPVSPVAGGLLEEIVREGAHHGLVDLVLEEGHRWLTHNAETFTDVVGERAPWWAPARLNDAVTARLHLEAVRWVDDIRRDPHHHARYALDSLLQQLAHDLLHDPATQARAERLKERVLSQPQLVVTGMSLWESLRRVLLEALADPEGMVRTRAVTELMGWGARLRSDTSLRARLDRRVADLVCWGVGRYASELTAVITHTVERWDGDEAARKIELHVGRDLQFVRINGTIVGGLVGVAIHAVTVLVGG